MTDIAIIGAGPYGLSIAAHLASAMQSTRVFGTPMQSWAQHMPPGMKLKSEGFASSLSDPGNTFTLQRFCGENNIPYADTGLPVPLEVFTAYGMEFQRRRVPHLEPTDIVNISRNSGGFTVTTATGESFQARKIVLASGIAPFPYIPAPFAGLPAEFVSHTFDHGSLTGFSGRTVAVVGAGASAIDTAALLREAGANVHIITRASRIRFHSRGAETRSLFQRIKNPTTGIGLGWKSKLCEDAPLLFHALPAKLRLRAVRRHLGPAPGWFVRDKVEGLIPTHFNTSITAADVQDGKLHLTLASSAAPSATLVVDHLIAGTGFRVDVAKIPMLDQSLRDSVQTLEGSPILSRNFESSVPGLYFAGLASAISFGPLTRFACGADFTANRIARHLI